MDLRWLAVACLGLAGCFTDSQVSSPGAADCTDGTRGCPCYGNGTCDPGLECLGGEGCFPQDCVEGTMGCPCFGNGTCNEGLTCDGIQCTDEGGSGGGTTTTAGTTTDASTTVDGTTTSGVTTDDSTTGSVGSCDVDPNDNPCLGCAKTNCCEQYTECVDDEGSCENVAACAFEDSGTYLSCLEGRADFGGAPLFTLGQCLATSPCPRDCVPESVSCLQDIVVPFNLLTPCRECVATNCCPQFEACLNEPRCACQEACYATADNPTECVQNCTGSGGAAWTELSACAGNRNQCVLTDGACYPPSSISPA